MEAAMARLGMDVPASLVSLSGPPNRNASQLGPSSDSDILISSIRANQAAEAAEAAAEAAETASHVPCPCAALSATHFS